MDPLLDRLSVAVPAARTLEALSRPLLEMLGGVSGLESTYLTSIDLDADVQRVQFARNAGALTIPEGLTVPWGDTLCKRALDEGRPYTDAVASCWGDSEAARTLGLQTHVSAPIRANDGTLLGTLCAASAERRPMSPDAQALLALFARLIGDFVERERLVERLRQANATLAAHAMSDPLTGLPNRRALVDELQRLLARARRERGRVLVGVVDLDGFKRLNDSHGHPVGDLLLQEVAGRLARTLRATDMLGRLGGDEFLIVGPGPVAAPAAAAQEAARLLQQRASAATAGPYTLGTLSLDYGGASVGVVAVDPAEADADEAVRLADARMYAVKRGRKSTLL